MTRRQATPACAKLRDMSHVAFFLHFAAAAVYACCVSTGFSGTAALARTDTSIASETVRALTSFAGEDREPAVSPNGKWIAYLSDRNGDRRNQLWILDLDTGSHRALLTDAPVQSPPAWTPDSKQLILSVADGNGKIELQSLDLATGTLSGPLFGRNVPDGNQMFPDVAPDGQTVSFTLATAGENSSLDLYLASFADASVIRLTDHPENDLWSRFEKSGTGLVFFSRRDTDGEADDIYHMNLATRQVTRLTHADDHDFVPAPSPDGRFIAFASRRGGSPALYVMKADGTGQRRLSAPGLHATHPTWGPDSKVIYFTGRQERGAPGDIMVMTLR